MDPNPNPDPTRDMHGPTFDRGGNGLTRQVVTPRFIPTCSDTLLEGLGRLAAKHRARGCWVQSHLAEVSSRE
jgi:cytosine/adenosine deaminase-related metal-dependent hydrolase